MDCEGCSYSKTEYQFDNNHELLNRTLFCYASTPTVESSGKVNVNKRPAPCFKHMAKGPLDAFKDLLPILEAMTR